MRFRRKSSMKADARYSQLADEELIRMLCDRDVAAFDELYERYVQRLLRYFHRMLAANEEQAQDFLQETFLRVIEKRSSFDPTGRFSTWIFAIAHNLCCNEYRRREVREKAPLEGANFMPVRNVEPDEELQRRLFAESLVSRRRDSFTKSLDFRKDGISCRRPHERVCVGVPLGGVSLDALDEL